VQEYRSENPAQTGPAVKVKRKNARAKS